MSKRQGNLLNYFSQHSKKARSETEERIVLEENRNADTAIYAEKISTQLSNKSVPSVEQNNLKPTAPQNPFDIGSLVGESCTDKEKYDYLQKVWVPNDLYKFPLGQRNLKFQKKWLSEFQWLCYSELKEGAFCKYCVIFAKDLETGKGQHVKLGAFVNVPFKRWKDAKEDFRKHEANIYHQKCCISAQNFISVFENKIENIVSQLDKGRKEKILENRRKLIPIIKTIILCGRQEIALRGHFDSGLVTNEDTPCSRKNEGNFRALLRFRIESGDETLKNHLENCGNNSSYTSPLIQNEIIESCGNIILSNIVIKINESECFSILADETADISGVEQFALCARYTEKIDGKMFLREDFLKFVPIENTSGLTLAKTIEKELTNAGVNMKFLRGQGYDGAAAMSGMFKGCAAVMRMTFPEAIYVHCSSHALNLVLCHSCSVPAIRNSLATLKEVISFFRLSTKRRALLKNIILSDDNKARRTRLLKFCETRWIEHLDSILLFKELFSSVLEALSEAQNCNDAETSSKAFLLTTSLNGSQFLISLCVVSKVFSLAHGLCTFLQSKQLDIASAVKHTQSLKEEIEEMRAHAEASFEPIYSEAQSIANNTGTTIQIPRICSRQTTRANYTSTINNPEEYYRISLYIPFLDFFIQEMNDRFLNHKLILEKLSFLLPEKCIKMTHNEIEECCEILSDKWPNDVSSIPAQFIGELHMWKRIWLKRSDFPREFISTLNECEKHIFPTVHKFIKIASTLPITTASAERSFSSLRRLKNYLRNSISQNRLNGLAQLSIHREIAVDPEEVLNEMSKKPRKLEFLI